ncbi:Hypothetical predicted protein, partial [Paramuricea clavata]
MFARSRNRVYISLRSLLDLNMNGRRYRRSPDRTKKSVKENVALPEASEILSYRDKSLDM